MATQIKETPVLVGEDADRFFAEIEANQNKTVSAADYRRGVDTFESVRRATFESWCKRQTFPLCIERNAQGDYAYPTPQFAWEVWQAATN